MERQELDSTALARHRSYISRDVGVHPDRSQTLILPNYSLLGVAALNHQHSTPRIGRPPFLQKMRELTDHKINGLNDALIVQVLDEPGCGGANHKYEIVYWPIDAKSVTSLRAGCRINFQNGPILEAGFNGISNEALLAVIIDRMRGFQSGPFASRDNACALTNLEQALMWLQKRTRDRMARGVEGTHQQ